MPVKQLEAMAVIKLHGAEEIGLTPAQIEYIRSAIDGDLELLIAFAQRVDRLERSGFSRRYEADVPRVIAKMDNVSLEKAEGGRFSIVGRVHSWIEDFSQDEIDAFVLSYRVFTQNNDRLSIPSISRIFAKDWVHPEVRESFENARRQLNDHLDSIATVEFPNGKISVRMVVDIVIYGGLAHSNERKSRIFNVWEGSGFMGFIWADFMAYAKHAVATLKYIRDLIRDLASILQEHGLILATVDT
ncbi:MAG: hypothetical protein WBH00_16595 [Xanthobacteraceae bacterium]